MGNLKGLTLEELDGQDAELLPDRIVMRRRRRRRPVINNFYTTNNDFVTVNNTNDCDASGLNASATCSNP